MVKTRKWSRNSTGYGIKLKIQMMAAGEEGISGLRARKC